MGEFALGQVLAAWLALVFLAIGAIGLIRLTRIPTLVLVLSWLGVPVLAFAKYALWPQPLGSFDAINIAIPFVGLGLTLGVAGFVLRIVNPPVSTFASILRRVPLFLLTWPCLVVAISFLVVPFEPGFAVANLALNAVWFAAWIPQRVRRVESNSSYEIAAPRERVFAFISTPANWMLYRRDVESAEVWPDGLLQVGSQIVARRRIEYRGLRGPQVLLPRVVESVETVTMLVPNELMATRRTDGIESEAAVELSSAGNGTVVSTRSKILLPYRLAVVGGVLELLLGRSREMTRARDSQQRVRRLLEEPSVDN